jgi:opine dehydrogenase
MATPLQVAVLGAGNAGQAFAGWLASQGCAVRITDLLPEVVGSMAPVRRIELTGAISCRGDVTVVADPRECVRDAELIILATAAPGHCPLMAKAAPVLRDGQVLMVQPGYWSHVTIPRHLLRRGFHPDLVHVQTESLIYTCRALEPGRVRMDYIKREMGFAVRRSPRAGRASRLLRRFWPQLRRRRNVLEDSLDNVNFTMHPTIMLLNGVTSS